MNIALKSHRATEEVLQKRSLEDHNSAEVPTSPDQTPKSDQMQAIFKKCLRQGNT
jgi:hypothetical protein